MSQMLSGMNCLAFGGIQLKDYPGRCWESRLCMDVSSDRYKLLDNDTLSKSYV